MTYVPLSRLLPNGRAAGHAVGIAGGVPVDFERFARSVACAAALLRPSAGRRAALVCQDSLWFAAGFLALLQAGLCVVIPSNAKPTALSTLSDEVDLVVSDEPLDVGMPLVRLGTDDGTAVRLAPIDPAVTTIEFFTSGSTGAPKRIPKPLVCLEHECEVLEGLWGASLSGSPVLATVSHQHLYGMTFKVFWSLSAGRPFAAETHDLWEPLLAGLPAGAVLVTSPAHLTRLTGIVPISAVLRPRMVLSAGAPLPPSAARETAEILGVLPTEIFGSTETGAIASRSPAAGDEPWRPLPGVTTSRTRDGRLAIRSPFLPGDGYHEGADLVEVAPDGRFRFQGRAGRIAKIEGKRVSLPEVEERLLRLPLVEAAAATVLSNGRSPHLAAAVVLTEAGRALLAQLGGFRFGRLLRRELSRALESAALPRRWRYLDALPSTAMGKRSDADVRALFERGSG